MSTNRTVIALIVLSLVLFLPGINSVPMMDRDSAHFAQASKQMLESGNFFQIRFQDITRFQKPPGINWLQAISVKVSGQSLNTAWPYRLPSFMGGLLSILCLFAFVNRLINQEVAIVSASLLASTLLLMVESHLAVIDAELLLSVILMQGALWVLYHEAPQDANRYRWALCFWLAMSYGFVLKGVTPLVGFLTILSLCVSDKSLKPFKMTMPLWGLLLFLLSCVWVFSVSDAEGTNYLFKMIEKDLLPKLTGGHESHGQPPLFHLAILPLTFWPASLFLFLGFRYAWSTRATKTTRFLLCWIVPTWAFFELMPTKLPQYVLPTFPALAILCAQAVVRGRAKSSQVYRALLMLWLLISLVISAGFIIAPLALEMTPSAAQITYTIVIALLAFIAFYMAFYERFKESLVITILLSVISFPLLYGGLLPSLKPLWLTNCIQRTIDNTIELKQVVNDKTPLIADGYQEPSLAFTLGTNRVVYQSYHLAFKRNQAVAVLIPSNEAVAFRHKANTLNRSFKNLASFRGFNYNKGKWLDLKLLLLEPKQS